MNKPISNRPWLMQIKPLWLREKLYWKLYRQYSQKFKALFQSAKLEFAPQVLLQLMPTDTAHQELAFLGFYELEVSRRIAKLAQLGGLMVDVGANYGYYSCLWAAVQTDNRVVAFEASPRNFAALNQNLKQNQLTSQVTVHQTAVGQLKGSLPFTLGPEEQSGWGGLLGQNQVNTIEVPVVSLDEIFPYEQSVSIQVLKIDTEGADTWVLQGAINLLRSHRVQHIFFEENLVRMAELNIQPGEAQTLLKNCGYQVASLRKGEWYASLK
ncbi:FkbM family methyltransferase [Trichocoleus desertorum AS-A10]|uniref:FkbM family methyltransferase n=1 Tax=Trichocoleus desertorum TaxID=1481672 RepID=UPI003297E0BE